MPSRGWTPDIDLIGKELPAMPQILLCCVLALLLAALGLLLRSLHRRPRPSGGNETLKALLV